MDEKGEQTNWITHKNETVEKILSWTYAPTGTTSEYNVLHLYGPGQRREINKWTDTWTEKKWETREYKYQTGKSTLNSKGEFIFSIMKVLPEFMKKK